MKLISLLLITLFLNVSLQAQSTCNNIQILGPGVDPWPWAVAQPFPWDNIDGFWKLGSEEGVYIRAKVSRRTPDKNKKLLQLWIHREGVCSRPIARGNGYIDIADKNVVYAFMIDSTYRFRVRLASFAMRDISEDVAPTCDKRVLAASYQVIGLASRGRERVEIDPAVLEVQNMLLKKVTVDPDVDCKK